MFRTLHCWFVDLGADSSSADRSCDWSFMDRGFVEIDDVHCARKWLARDQTHNHPTSVVEIRGKAMTPATFYLDWDNVPLDRVPQYLDHLGSVVLKQLFPSVPTLTLIVTTTEPSPDGTVGMHTIVPELVTTSTAAKLVRNRMLRYDSSLASIIDLQPTTTSLRMPNTFKAASCPKCKKDNVKEETEYCSTCHSTRFVHKPRVHQVRQVIVYGPDSIEQDFELARWAVCCKRFSCYITSIRTDAPLTGSSFQLEEVRDDAADEVEKASVVRNSIQADQNEHVATIQTILQASLRNVSDQYDNVQFQVRWFVRTRDDAHQVKKIEVTQYEGTTYLYGRMRASKDSVLLYCPYLKGHHRTNVFVVELSPQGFRVMIRSKVLIQQIRCFSRKKTPTKTVCSDSHRNVPFGFISSSDRTAWKSAVLSMVGESSCLAQTKRPKIAASNSTIRHQQVRNSTTLDLSVARRMQKFMSKMQ